MIILGISNTKDSGASLLINGDLVAAVSEERFTREKLTRKFPFKCVKWIIENFNLKNSDIDIIAIGSWKGISNEV